MKQIKFLLGFALFLLSGYLYAVPAYISCYENLDLDLLKTNLALQNFDVSDSKDTQKTQFDFCFITELSTQERAAPRPRVTIGVGVGRGHYHGHRGRYGYTGFGFDPFLDDYYSSNYEQNYLYLYIKDNQDRPIWKKRAVINNDKQLNEMATKLIRQIPIELTFISNKTQINTQPEQVE